MSDASNSDDDAQTASDLFDDTDTGTDPTGDTDGPSELDTDAAPELDGDGHVDHVDTLAENIDTREVWDTNHEDIGVYQVQRHRNGDVTIVQLSSFADGWQAFAIEVDAGGQVLETEVIGSADEHTRAVGMCEYWLQQHPKGILGTAGDDDDGGLLAGLLDGVGGD